MTCIVKTVSGGSALAEANLDGGEVRAIMLYPFAQVREKILMDGKLPEDVVDEAIAEFRKYFSLIAVGHTGLGMISPVVDEVWHTFILFTRDYAEFCERMFGRFVHHQPGLPSQSLGTEPRRRFIEAYRAVYGDLPAIWGDGTDQCFSTCDTPSTNCQEPSCK